MGIDKVEDKELFASVPAKKLEETLAKMIYDPGSFNELKESAIICRDRILNMMTKVEKEFVDRDEAVETVVAGLACGISVVLFGPPGTAKSALIGTIAEGMGLNNSDGKYFEYLLTNHTMPEELFGSVNLKELADGNLRIVTTNKLPEAEIAFLDELFRGGSHILNTLLGIVNEKRYDSGDGVKQVPLLGLVGASNSAPTDPDLDAFYDRFPVRVWLDSVFEQNDSLAGNLEENLKTLIEKSIDKESKRIIKTWSPEIYSEASKAKKENHRIRPMNQETSTNDFRVIRAYVVSAMRKYKYDTRLEQYTQFFKKVKDRCKLSDRSYAFLWLFASTYDFIRGNDEFWEGCENDLFGHIDVFKYVARNKKDLIFLRDLVREKEKYINYTNNA